VSSKVVKYSVALYLPKGMSTTIRLSKIWGTDTWASPPHQYLGERVPLYQVGLSDYSVIDMYNFIIQASSSTVKFSIPTSCQQHAPGSAPASHQPITYTVGGAYSVQSNTVTSLLFQLKIPSLLSKTHSNFKCINNPTKFSQLQSCRQITHIIRPA
jgi:hypothetical protein